MCPLQHLKIKSLLYKEAITLYTTKTVPVVYSTENSPDGELYEIWKISIKVLQKGGGGQENI